MRDMLCKAKLPKQKKGGSVVLRAMERNEDSVMLRRESDDISANASEVRAISTELITDVEFEKKN